MSAIRATYNGLALVFELNWDLFLYVAVVGVSLGATAYSASIMLFPQ